jgi:hypothetical protein
VQPWLCTEDLAGGNHWRYAGRWLCWCHASQQRKTRQFCTVPTLDCLVGRSEITQAIRSCKVFVPLMNTAWAESGECELEQNLALNLNSHSTSKPRRPHFLPVLFSDVEVDKHDHVLLLSSNVRAAWQPTDARCCPGPRSRPLRSPCSSTAS